jgi:hypothetical protein
MDTGMSFFAMPLLCNDICLEKRDEANLPRIDGCLFPFGLELRTDRNFIPFFGPCKPCIERGIAKKDIPVSIGFIRVEIMLSARAKNNFQKAKIVAKIKGFNLSAQREHGHILR